MTLEKLAALLDAIPGLAGKVAYYAFPEAEAPPLPYLVSLETGSDNFIADNKVYAPFKAVNIELYTKNKDIALEEAVEAALGAAEIVWVKSADYLDSERCWMIVYSITI